MRDTPFKTGFLQPGVDNSRRFTVGSQRRIVGAQLGKRSGLPHRIDRSGAILKVKIVQIACDMDYEAMQTTLYFLSLRATVCGQIGLMCFRISNA
ncbi:hypothetical protein CHS0354_015473 [Potamilus streckersoni]|uniref:Uncharacterized protein n=1 Tax=Potamilus streckersoni TaxID=2493646 RepID=A0AAE0SFN5_9BIVA|nr:hypothetical protein CHS0354_015473 [Potamilus streckersoni]